MQVQIDRTIQVIDMLISLLCHLVYRCSLMKTLPCYGKLYISTNHVSFNSKGFATKAKVMIWEGLVIPIDAHPTKMIIPFSDIMRIQKIRSKGYIFHALSILTQNKKEVSSVNQVYLQSI